MHKLFFRGVITKLTDKYRIVTSCKHCHHKGSYVMESDSIDESKISVGILLSEGKTCFRCKTIAVFEIIRVYKVDDV